DPTDIYTLSLHDALPISGGNIIGFDFSRRQKLLGSGKQLMLIPQAASVCHMYVVIARIGRGGKLQLLQHLWKILRNLVRVLQRQDRKSTRLNSSHDQISY